MDATVPDPRDSHRDSHRQSRFREDSELQLQDLSFSSRRPHHPEIHLEEGAGLGHRPLTRASTGLGIEDGTTSPVSPQSPQIQPLRGGSGGYAQLHGTETNTRSARLVHGSPNEGYESATTTPGTAGQPFFSPESTYGFQQQHTEYRGHRGIDSSTAYRGAYHRIDSSTEYQGGYGGIDASIHQQGTKHFQNKPSVSSYNSDLYDPFLTRPIKRLPAVKFPSEPSREQMPHEIPREMPPAYGAKNFNPATQCRSHEPFVQSATKWLSLLTYLLALFSTILSGLFFGVAIVGPEWAGIHGGEGATLSPSDAILVTSVLAKVVELTFVTVFITFLGQALSRRAFQVGGRGMNLAEMNMRSWITQPGTMITHWDTVRYAGLTGLGILSLVAATLTTLYAPATTTLVQPQLRFGDWKSNALQSVVKTQWGDQNHVATQCNTPQVNDGGDPNNPTDEDRWQASAGLKQAHTSCLQIEYAAQSYHNYMRYFKSWNPNGEQRIWSQDMKKRPRGLALWEEKTAVDGAWIDQEDVALSSAEIDRTVHKVHLAMPHVGVVQAAAYGPNKILQPDDLDGQGIYRIHASAPAPVVHVTCAHLTKEDVSPLVYETWPGVNATEDKDIIDKWTAPSWGSIAELNMTAAPRNTTMMDSLFGWSGDGTVEWLRQPSGELAANPEDMAKTRPVFGYLPSPANTVLNQTGTHGRRQIYLLGTVPRPVPNTTVEDTYLLCSLQASLTGACSTHYNVSGPTEGSLEAVCEDDHDPWRFDKKYPLNSTYLGEPNKDWVWMAQEWGNSINLNDGRSGAGSNSRILTHLALPGRELNASMPSPAEALAVLAGSTLLMGMQDTQLTIDKVFPYNDTQLASGLVVEHFDAEIQAQLYASGYHSKPARGFMAVLFGVFLFNVLILIYFLVHVDFVTDYTEPPNMFAITLNSPPAREFAGSCGGGPHKRQFDVGWRLAYDHRLDNGHLYLAPGDQNARRISWRPRKTASTAPLPQHTTPGGTPDLPSSPFLVDYDKFAKRRSLI